MGYRKLYRSDLKNKTVVKFSHPSLNYLHLTFSDGTELELWAENIGPCSAFLVQRKKRTSKKNAV